MVIIIFHGIPLMALAPGKFLKIPSPRPWVTLQGECSHDVRPEFLRQRFNVYTNIRTRNTRDIAPQSLAYSKYGFSATQIHDKREKKNLQLRHQRL